MGSFAAYIEPHHPDILAFLNLRRNHGDENLRTRDLFLALWISDLYWKVEEAEGGGDHREGDDDDDVAAKGAVQDDVSVEFAAHRGERRGRGEREEHDGYGDVSGFRCASGDGASSCAE